MIYLTTTKLAEKLEIDSKQLFAQLNEWGWIERRDKRWVLTDLGRDKGGQTRSAPEIGEFVVWPDNTVIDIVDSSQMEQVEVTNDEEIDAKEISEGEDYIAEYFDAIEMEYRRQHVIEGLSDNFSSYRVADFYLPKYKIMVEFAGRWNRSEDERKRYRNKKEVYKANGIPCLWLYPDNLGVLHYIFHKRFEAVLGNHSLEKGLLRYRLTQFWKEDRDNFHGLGLGIFSLSYISIPWSENTGWVWFSVAVIGYNLYKIIKDLNLILKGKSIQISRLNKWED